MVIAPTCVHPSCGGWAASGGAAGYCLGLLAAARGATALPPPTSTTPPPSISGSAPPTDRPIAGIAGPTGTRGDLSRTPPPRSRPTGRRPAAYGPGIRPPYCDAQ